MRKFLKYPWLIIAGISLITAFFAAQLPQVELDNNNLRFVPPDDPALQVSRRIDETFGSNFFILVGLERPGGTVLEAEFLETIREYVERISEIPIVGNISSLVNADYITAEDDSIVVQKITGEDFSGEPLEIEALKNRLLSWDLYKRALYSDDFSATQILVPLDISIEDAGDPEITKSYLQVRDIAREMFSESARVYVTGMPILTATINEAVHADLKLLVPLVILVVLLALFFSFRKISGVVLPMLTVLIACVWSVGAMPLFGIKLSVISTVLPVILIAVGSAYGIHVVTHYLHDLNGTESRETHREYIFSVMRKIGKPVLLAALTTFVAFVSFCFTPVAPIREFGYFASFGVAAAFAVAVTLIPALLLIRGPVRRKRREISAQPKERFSMIIAAGLTAAAKKRTVVLALTLCVIAFSVYGLSKLIVDNVMVEYFRNDTDIFKSDVFIRRQFGGSKVISVVLEAEDTETLLHPDSLGAMDDLARYIETSIPNAGKVMGFTSLVKRINQVYNGGDASWYEIPRDPARYGKDSPQALQRLISNYLVLLSGDIGQYADDSLEPLAVKSTIQLRTVGMDDSKVIFRQIEDFIAANFPPSVKATLGGTTMVEGSLNDLVVQSQIVSVLISIVCVFIILAVSNRSLLAGCIGIAPLSISILINFAVMGLSGIKLNLGTSMVASVSVGVGIDYTIHCLEAYKREYHITGGVGDFLLRTFLSSGKAIIINAVSVGAGFAVLLFSRFTMLADLGLLIAITMFSSALISLTVLPALLLLIKPRFIGQC